MAAKKLSIKQVRSPNGASRKQKETLRSLGLGRIGKSAERSDGPALQGQLDKVGHLVEVGE
jgi:large subunit ribosomal protein L30